MASHEDWSLGPRKAMIELVSVCNLKCPSCPTGNGSLKRASRWMSFEAFVAILEPAATTLDSVALFNYGESTLHRDLCRCIRAARALGVPQVLLHTNGQHMPVALARELVDSGLSRLRFSLDGVDQASYETYRTGGRFERLCESIRTIGQCRTIARTDRPRIELQCLVMAHTEGHLARARSLARLLGADRLVFKTFNPLMSGPAYEARNAPLLPNEMPLRRALLDYRDRIPAEQERIRRCEWPRQHLVVHSDLFFAACCHDFNASHAVGQVSRDGRWTWADARRTDFIARLAADPESIDLCNRCPHQADLTVRSASTESADTKPGSAACE